MFHFACINFTSMNNQEQYGPITITAACGTNEYIKQSKNKTY